MRFQRLFLRRVDSEAEDRRARTRRRGRDSRGRLLRLEPLEDRRLLSVAGPQNPNQSRLLPANVEGNLAEYWRSVQSPAAITSDAAGTGQTTPQANSQTATGAASPLAGLLELDSTGRPLVDVWTTGPTSPVVSQLNRAQADVLLVNEPYRLVEAWVAPADLPAIATMDGVLSVTPVYRPILHAGSVQTQGDAVIHGDQVRAQGYDGSPILVGAMSDSALDIANSQTTGDLPPVVDRYLEFWATDEGRAMLEIVHDVAPGAALAHHSAILSDSSFAQGIRELAAAGASVICDDVWYYAEPFFQDGIIAQAVNDVTASGVTYVSAAGNDADRSYEATFTDAGGGFHDFDPSGAVDTRQQVTVPAGYGVTLILQWDDPFYTTAGVTHDFNVRVYDAAGTKVVEGVTNNISTQQPLEAVSWTSSGTGVYQVEIQCAAGSGTSQLKYILSTNSNVGTIDEYATHSGTVVGHKAAAGAIAVGAVPYSDPTHIEPFSSYGNATIYFDPAGNRLATPEVRHKPDLVAPDRVSTAVPGFAPFAGTSAAAPHVAGAAALILDVNPHLTRRNSTTS